MAIVYEHYRNDTNEVFYVGIGKTVARSKSKQERNNHWHNIVNKFGYTIKVVEKNLTWDNACELEKELIKKYGRRDLNTGSLVNMTDGGEGISNLSPESKKLLREQKLGEGNPRFGKFGSENYNAKLTEDDVKHILNVFVENDREFGIRALAKKFNVDRGTIKKIVDGVSYLNVTTNVTRTSLLDKTKTPKFTPENIKYIRDYHISHHPEFGTKPMSIKFNTSESRIWKIVTKRVWKNI